MNHLAETVSPSDDATTVPNASRSRDRQKPPRATDETKERRNFVGFVTRFPMVLSHLPVYSWAWFLMPMTTFGLSTLIEAQTDLKDFHGLYTIGLVIYLIGLVQFFFLLMAKSAHFLIIKHSLRKSFESSEESMFFAAFWISCYGVVTGALDYARPKPGTTLSVTLLSFFWIYFACVLVASMVMHLQLFRSHQLESKQYTPAWLLPILPVILVGVMAGSLVDHVYPSQLYPALLAGLFCSSLGFLISLPLSAIYFLRLFTAGFPHPDTRPGMMIAVGPPTYTPLAYLKIAQGLPVGYAFFATHPLGIEILQTSALFISIGIFGMGVFFVFMALVVITSGVRKMSFHLTWYGLVFPNVGFLSTMGLLGLQIPSNGIIWVATAGTILLSATWLFVTTSHLIAILRKSKFLW